MKYIKAIKANLSYIQSRFIWEQDGVQVAAKNYIDGQVCTFIPIAGVILDPKTTKRAYSDEYFIVNGFLDWAGQVNAFLCTEVKSSLEPFWVTVAGRLYNSDANKTFYSIVNTLLGDPSGDQTIAMLQYTIVLSKSSLDI